jgi:hypothetical protein
MRTFIAASTLVALLAAAPAQAAQPAHGSPGELTGWLILGAGYGYHDGYDNGFGLGGRYRTALVPEGVLRTNASSIRDSIDLEFGADLVRYDYSYRVAPYNYGYSWTALRPRVGAMWDFWFTPQLAVYPKLDLGYQFGWFNGWDQNAGPHPGWSGLFLEPSLGLIWKFRPATSLRVEAGSEGLKLGLGFAY